MKRYVVTLIEEEREMLEALASKGSHRSQKILNALVLLACDRGPFQSARSTNEEISRVLNVSMRKIDRVKKRFVEDGLDVTLNGTKGQRVYQKKADGDFEAHLVALSCSEPPEGFARWSLRLLADRVVELDYIDNVSHETVRRVLKKRNQALAEKGMGNSAALQQQLCRAHGNGTRCLQAPLRRALPGCMYG
ncbi:MAG: hypothetical protein BMS9Abin05_2707 [Rhodothermia bacterium]|nr:MAG: hypothetical protein BMS9Abin05_2707 [Rhodothermia bacterium]